MITDPMVITDLAALIETAALSGLMISVRAEAVEILLKHRATHMQLAEVEAAIMRLANERKIPLRFD